MYRCVGGIPTLPGVVIPAPPMRPISHAQGSSSSEPRRTAVSTQRRMRTVLHVQHRELEDASDN